MDAAPDTKAILDQEIESGDLDGYLWITPASAPGGRPTFTYTPRSSGDTRDEEHARRAHWEKYCCANNSPTAGSSLPTPIP